MWSEFAQGAIIVVIAVSAALLVAWTTAWLVRRLALRRRSRLLAQLYRSCRRAWTAVLVVTSLYVAIPSLMLDAQGQVRHALELLLIAVGAWLLLKVLFVAEDTRSRCSVSMSRTIAASAGCVPRSASCASSRLAWSSSSPSPRC